MDKYEYKYQSTEIELDMVVDPNSIIRWLNKLGSEGWQVVGKIDNYDSGHRTLKYFVLMMRKKND